MEHSTVPDEFRCKMSTWNSTVTLGVDSDVSTVSCIPRVSDGFFSHLRGRPARLPREEKKNAILAVAEQWCNFHRTRVLGVEHSAWGLGLAAESEMWAHKHRWVEQPCLAQTLGSALAPARLAYHHLPCRFYLWLTCTLVCNLVCLIRPIRTDLSDLSWTSGSMSFDCAGFWGFGDFFGRFICKMGSALIILIMVGFCGETIQGPSRTVTGQVSECVCVWVCAQSMNPPQRLWLYCVFSMRAWHPPSCPSKSRITSCGETIDLLLSGE